MFYVYLLRSLKNGDVYIGYSENLKQRYQEHNEKRVKSTKINGPWKLVYYEAYSAKPDATKREKELKLHAAKNVLLKHLKNSLTFQR